MTDRGLIGGETASVEGAPAAAGGADLGAGEEIAGYVIEGLLGVGGMGVVYRARERALDRPVALKLISPAYASDPRRRDLFLRESRAAAALDHPNVVPIYRAGEEGERLFIAMRLVDGESLHAMLGRVGRLPAGRAARIVAQVAAALDAAHARGIVHRDVTPANILISDPGGADHAYLTDFGLAAQVSDGSVGGSPGTPGYRAPEIVAGAPPAASADIYALGTVLFRALTGLLPEPAGGAARRAGEVAAGVPPGFDDLLAKALAADPSERYPSAGALAAEALRLRFDVCIVHSPGDAGAADALAGALGAEGGEVTRASAGDGGLAIRSSNAVVVLLGDGGLGDWSREALVLAREIEGADPGFSIVTALADGAPDPRDARLAFLAGRPFVDLRGGAIDADRAREILRLARGRARARILPSTPGDVCPYRGLLPFDEGHADLFVGRENEIALAIEGLRAARYLTVLGPSGSGKSSLLRAGVIPALRSGALEGSAAWPVAALVPGARPARALSRAGVEALGGGGRAEGLEERILQDEAALDAAAGAALGPGRGLVVLVDQLEEAFTLCPDDAEREAALRALSYAATIPGGRVVVLLAMRADFYDRAAGSAALRALVQGRQLLVGPMDRAGLRRVIEEPARAVGLDLEPGLAGAILADVADRPGSLPLLEHVLLEVWERREGTTLTLAGYAASGGLEGALAKRANDTFALLDADGQAIARRVLLRLIQPGDGAADTRRSADLDELAQGEDGGRVQGVVEVLAAGRLVTLDRDAGSGGASVDLAHEALIRGWPELRGWIAQDRERLLRERRLTEATREWEGAGREEGLLYAGARLASWEDAPTGALSDRERAFLGASRGRAGRERATRRRRVRITVGALAAGVVLVSGAAGVALWQRGEATDQRDLALARKLAVDAETVLPQDPELALLLARTGYDVKAIRPDEEILRRAAFASHIVRTFPGVSVNGGVQWTPDGRRLVTGGDEGAILVWDPVAGTSQVLPGAPGGLVTHVALSADGSRVVSGGDDDAVRVWDLAGRRLLTTLTGHTGTITRVAFFPDGRRVASTAEDGTLRVWDLRTGRQIGMATVDTQRPTWVAVHPDGRSLATAGFDGIVRVWAPDGAGAAIAELPLTGAPAINALAWAPDGERLAVGGADAIVRIWNPSTGALARLPAQDGGQNVFAWSPDGRTLYAVAADGGVQVMDPGSRTVLTTLRGNGGDATGIAVSPDGRRLVTTSVDATIRVWDIAPARLPVAFRANPKGALGVEWSADGTTLVTPTNGGTVSIWPAAGGPAERSVPIDAGEVWSARLSGDGGRIVAGAFNGSVHIIDRASGEVLRRIDTGGALVLDVDFHPDGSLVVVGLNDNTARIYDPATGRVVRSLEGSGNWVWGVAFSDDGTHVATSGLDETVRVWETATGRQVAMTAAPEGIVWRPAFSRDGTLVAFGGDDDRAHVWDWRANTEVATLDGHTDAVVAAAFDPAGDLLATASKDRTLRIWDWRRGVAVAEIDGYRADVFGVAWSPDGSRVASTTTGGEVRVWACDTCGPIDEVERLAATRVSRELTPDERATFLPDS